MLFVAFLADPTVIEQVDGLGRNAIMYSVHGNTPPHSECLEILINADCDLDFQANGMYMGLPTFLNIFCIQV